MSMMEMWSAPIRLEEPSSDGQYRSWIMLMPEGEFTHPEYGKLTFDRAKLERFKRHFDERVRKIDIALDADHAAPKGDSRATGWIERMELREARGDVPGGLWACICWTPYGAQLLHDHEYKYFSPEFGNHTDEETGDEVKDVIIGGALTNRPFLKVMPSVTLAEVSRTAWGSIKKSSLPRACFLVQGDPDLKSTWKLPVYESNGKGGRGKLNINGVKAAWAAVNGAHTGTPMDVPGSVKSKLQRWVKQYSTVEGNMAEETIRLMGAESAVAKRPGKSQKRPPAASKVDDYDPTDVDDSMEYADGEEGEEMDDAEGGEEYADDEEGDEMAEEDGEDEEDAEDEPPSKKMSRRMSRRMSGNLGNFGGKKAPPFRKGGAPREMNESVATVMLREQNAAMQRQLNEQRYALYETGVDKILAAWRQGKTLLFGETHSAVRNPGPGRRVSRQATVVMTPKVERMVRGYLLSEAGYRLSESSRMQFLEIVQTCLSESLVDLSVRGASWDQEARETIRNRSANARGGEDELMALAEGYAAQDKKLLSELVGDEAMKYYSRASKAIAYKGV